MRQDDHPIHDPFEELLRARLGPSAKPALPAGLRARVLAAVAAQPAPLPAFRLRAAHLAQALSAAALAAMVGWLATAPLKESLRGLRTPLAELARDPSWRSLLDIPLEDLLGGRLGAWFHHPLALAVLVPLILLPLVHLFREEF